MGNTNENIKHALSYYEQRDLRYNRERRRAGCMSFILLLGMVVAVVVAVAILVEVVR